MVTLSQAWTLFLKVQRIEYLLHERPTTLWVEQVCWTNRKLLEVRIKNLAITTLKTNAFTSLGETPSVKAKFSAVNGLTKLEGVDAAMKHVNNMAKAVSLASAPKFATEIAKSADSFGKFIH